MDLLIRAYPSLGMRPMTDIDLLIHKKDIPKVKRLLEHKDLQWSADENLSYYDPNSFIILDIVWNVWYMPDSRPVWQRSSLYATNEGKALKLMHSEDALTYLIAYTIAHRTEINSIFLQDLKFFLDKESHKIDWDHWASTVKNLHLGPTVFYGLSYVRKSGLESIPEEIVCKLRPTSYAEKKLNFYYQNVLELKKKPANYLRTWLSYPGWRGKIKLLRIKFLPSKWQFELRFGRKSWLKYLIFCFAHPFCVLFRALTGPFIE